MMAEQLAELTRSGQNRTLTRPLATCQLALVNLATEQFPRRLLLGVFAIATIRRHFWVLSMPLLDGIVQ